MKNTFKLASLLIALLFVLCLAPFAAFALDSDGADLPVYSPDEGSDLPSWYPEDPSSWTYTPAAEDAPRVVDNADVLSDDEERTLEAHIRGLVSKLPEELRADIVIMTDVTEHGKGVDVYSADFFMYNGYGFFESHEGFCLFLDMDPNDRQGWCCVTGDRSRSLYTEDTANEIDDQLYYYLGNREYFKALWDWAENIYFLLLKGKPFTPSWYPNLIDQRSFARFHNSSLARVADETGDNAVSAEEIASLTEKAKAISDAYGIDVAVVFTNNLYSFTDEEYADAYYFYNGLGFGGDYSGLILLYSLNHHEMAIKAYGKASSMLGNKLGRISEAASGDFSKGRYGKSAETFLDYLGRTLKTGRVPLTPGRWALRIVIVGLIAFIASTIITAAAKSKMVTVAKAYGAKDYILSDSIAVGALADEFVSTSVSRVYSPVQKDTNSRGGGGSSGRSSYSGGYHSSSGSSHSGSGRHF